MRFLLALLLAFSGLNAAGAAAVRPQYVVNTLAELEALHPLSVSSGGRAYVGVLGNLQAGDWGGMRLFRADTNSSATPSAHVRTNVAGLGRWISSDASSPRQSLRWFLTSTNSADAALDATDAYLDSIGGGLIEFPAGRWVLTNAHTVSHPIVGQGIGVTIIEDARASASAASAITWRGSIGTPAALAVAAPKGTNSLRAIGLSVAAGDTIYIADTNAYSYSPFRSYYHAGEAAKVASNDGTNIVLVTATRGAYATTAKIWPVTPVSGGISDLSYEVAADGLGPRFQFAANSYIRDVAISGTTDSHIAIDCSVGVDIDGVRIWDATGPNIGLNYGVAIGYSEDVTVRNSTISTLRHAVTAGSARGVLGVDAIPILCRSIRVAGNSYLASVEDTAVDCHGNTEDMEVSGNIIRNGVSVAGNRIRVIDNPHIGNATNSAALVFGEQTGGDLTVRGNTFSIALTKQDFGTYVWGVATTFGHAVYGATTNWVGTVASGSEQLVVSDNTFRVLNPPMPSGGHLLGFVGESPLVPTNAVPWVLGSVVWRNNDCPDCYSETSGNTAYGVQILPISRLRIDRVQISGAGNGNLGAYVATSGRYVEISDYALDEAVGSTSYGAIHITSASGISDAGRVLLRNVAIRGSRGSVLPVFISGVSGQLEIHDLRAENWNTGNAITIAAPALTNIYVSDASFRSISNNVTAWSVTATNARAHLVRPRYEASGGSVTNGTWNVASLIQMRDDATVTTHTGQPFQPDAIPTLRSVSALIGSGYSTNDFRALGIAGQTLSLSLSPGAPFTTWPAPLYVFGDTNEMLRAIVQNPSTGTSAGAGLESSALGASAVFGAMSTNRTGGNVGGRTWVQSSAGTGMTFDLASPSMDIVWSHSSGTEMARMGTNEFLLTLPDLRLGTGRKLTAPWTPYWHVGGALTADSVWSTNALRALNASARTLSIGTSPGTPFAAWPAPVAIFGATNTNLRTVTLNADTGTLAAAGDEYSAVGAGGSLSVYSTNRSSGNIRARTVLQSSTGAGITYDVRAAGDNVWTYDGGSEIARMSKSELLLTLPNLRLASGRSISLGGRAITGWLTNIADIAGLQAAIDGKQPTNANLTTLAALNGSILTNLNGSEIRSGTVADARIDSAIARDAEMAALYQPLNGYLTDISGMTGLAGSLLMFDGTDLTPLGLGSNGQIPVATNAAPYIQYRTPGTATWRDVPSSGNASSTQVVLGNDSRLSDARTPTSHTHPSTDISDSTSAGRALMTAADAAAQRSSLGLGTIATINDAPSDGYQYVRKNGAWETNSATASGAGGGGTNVPVAMTILATTGSVTVDDATTSETSLISAVTANSSTNLAAGSLSSGALLRMRAHGRYTAVSVNQTGTLRFKLGSYTASIQLDEPESYQPTNAAWTAEINILVESAGASATVKSWGTMLYEQVETATYAGGATLRHATNSGSLDTTASMSVGVTWQNSIDGVDFTCTGIVVERLGQNVSVGGGTGTKTILRWNAEQGFQPSSNPATFAARNTLGVMEFDPSTQEAIRFRSVVPEAVTATTATVVLKWTTDATSGDGRWGVRFWSLTGDIDSDSFATIVEGTTTTSGTAGTINTTTITAVGLDSAAAGDGIVLEVYRDVGDSADTINSNDIQLHTVEVRTE